LARLPFHPRITGRLRVLPLPFTLLFLGEEPHSGRFPLDASAIFDDLHIAIDLDLVQDVLLVFSVPRFKAKGVVLLCALEGAAEIGIKPCAMVLEEYKLLLEALGIELRVLGPSEAFEPAHGLVKASIH
jgi:hypothetical protein